MLVHAVNLTAPMWCGFVVVLGVFVVPVPTLRPGSIDVAPAATADAVTS